MTLYPDATGTLQPSRRAPRALTYRTRYRLAKWCLLVVPASSFVAGLLAVVLHENAWRQSAAEDQVTIATLRNQVNALLAVMPRRVCYPGRES